MARVGDDFIRAPLEGLLGLIYKRARSRADLMIAAYNGHGTNRRMHVQGRVLVNKLLLPPSPRDSAWKNFRNTAKRFLSAEIEGALIRGTFAGQSLNAYTDSEGFFNLTFHRDVPLPFEGWQPVYLELLHPSPIPPVSAQGKIWVVNDPEYGVISDIDDTVLHSDVAFRMEVFLASVFKNAHTRLPLEGVSEFYQRLVEGTGVRSPNPIFYVSNSPWNMYDVLVDFFRIHGIPEGSLFLRDWSLRSIHESQGRHKRNIIERILATYPKLDFILIGDSGEKDPEIYRDIALSLAHRGRIRAIYIRSVRSKNPERQREVQELADQLAQQGVDMQLVASTEAAVEHARRSLFIR